MSEVNLKTGSYYEKRQRLTPNWMKILELFVTNYKHHKLEEKERFLDDEEINNLIDLIAEHGEEHLIKFLAESLIEKQKIINYHHKGVDAL